MAIDAFGSMTNGHNYPVLVKNRIGIKLAFDSFVEIQTVLMPQTLACQLVKIQNGCAAMIVFSGATLEQDSDCFGFDSSLLHSASSMLSQTLHGGS
jgi:hypothetical protein